MGRSARICGLALAHRTELGRIGRCPGTLRAPISRPARATSSALAPRRWRSAPRSTAARSRWCSTSRAGGRGHRRERPDGRRHRRHPEGDDRRQLAPRCVHRWRGLRRAGREARCGCSRARWAARWRRSGRWSARTSASSGLRSRSSEDGLRHSVRIGDAVDFEIEDVVPFGVETGEPARLTGIFHPAGSELTVAHATRSKIDAFGIQYEGKAAFSTSNFSWAA